MNPLDRVAEDSFADVEGGAIVVKTTEPKGSIERLVHYLSAHPIEFQTAESKPLGILLRRIHLYAQCHPSDEAASKVDLQMARLLLDRMGKQLDEREIDFLLNEGVNLADRETIEQGLYFLQHSQFEMGFREYNNMTHSLSQVIKASKREIFSELIQFPLDLLESRFQVIYPALHQGETFEEAFEIIRMILNIPSEKIKLCEKIEKEREIYSPLIEGADPSEAVDMLEILEVFTHHEVEQLSTTRELIAFPFEDRLWIVRNLALVEKRQRLSALNDFLQRKGNISFRPVLHWMICLPTLLFHLITDSSPTRQRIDALLLTHPEFNEPIRAHLCSVLERSWQNRVTIDFALDVVSNFILGYLEHLSILPNDPLAIDLLLTTHFIDTIKNPQNPIVVFEQVRSRQEGQLALSDAFSRIDLSKEDALDMSRFKAGQKPITFADLPPVTFGQLKDIFDRLRTRAITQSAALSEAIRNKLPPPLVPGEPDRPDTRSVFEILDSIHWIQNPLIQQWMREKGEPQQLCPPHIYQLCHIVHFLNQLSREIQPNGLSEQEEIFLSFSNSIYNCKAGLQEGLSIVYQKIAEETLAGSHLDFAQFVQAKVQQAIQALLESLFRNPSFLQDASGTSDISQGSHLTLFAKNSLARLAGLQHQVEFDPHTEMLPLELVQKPLEDLANTYFKYFTLNDLLKEVQNRIDCWLAQKKGAFNDLNRYFGKDAALYIGVREVDVEGGIADEIFLTSDGALQILIREGYLHKK